MVNFLSGNAHTYELSDVNGSVGTHTVMQTEHEECARSPDGKGKKIEWQCHDSFLPRALLLKYFHECEI